MMYNRDSHMASQSLKIKEQCRWAGSTIARRFGGPQFESQWRKNVIFSCLIWVEDLEDG
jgi:hypothetical protein